MREFGPAPRGRGLLYSLALAGCGLWLAWTAVFDMALFSTGAQPDNSYAGAAILAVSAAFLAAACAFWFYPWRAARLRITEQGLTVWTSVKRAPVEIPWQEITGLRHADFPRGAATFAIETRSLGSPTLAVAALEAGGEALARGIAEEAARYGVTLVDDGMRIAQAGGHYWRRDD